MPGLDLDLIREAHSRSLTAHVCVADNNLWPCLTVRLVDEIDALRDRQANAITVLDAADDAAQRSLSRTFDGTPFLTHIRTADVRAALTGNPS